jgi:hypothetical protein
MTSQHSGNFRAKHPQDTTVAPALMDRVAADIVAGNIACKTAHAIARKLNVAPSQVGIAIDLHNGRINACQLGLFGYGKGKKFVTQKAVETTTELEAVIRNKLIDGKLSCADAWQIADANSISRLQLGCHCEYLGIKINQCQLGAFG